MDEIKKDEKASQAKVMEGTEESLKRLEKKYEDVLEKYKEYRRDGEEKKQEKEILQTCLPSRLPRMEVRADEQSSKILAMKEKVCLLEGKTQAQSSTLALAKKRLEEIKEAKNELQKKMGVIETRMGSRRTKMAMAAKAVEKMKPLADVLERDVTHFEEIYTKNEEEYVKVREKNRKVVIYQTEGNKRSLGNEELEKTIQLLTRRSQEQKEVCKELKSKEKAAMEKIDDCYQKTNEEGELIAEINTTYERKWTKVHESLGHCNRLIEASNLEIQELKDDTPVVTADLPVKQKQEAVNQEQDELVIVGSVELKRKEVDELPPIVEDCTVVLDEITLDDCPLYIDEAAMQDSPMYVEDTAWHDSTILTEDIIDITEESPTNSPKS